MNNPMRNNQTKPNTDTDQTNRPARGISRSRVSVNKWKPDEGDGMPPWSERRADLFRKADEHLSDQHPGYTVVAMIALEMRGEELTRKKVLERLRASGREASQIGYGPGGEAA